jgi:hypothetical protein
MAGIFGHLNLANTERVFASTVGKEVIFEAAQDYIARVNAEIDAQTSLFVESETENYSERYKLAGGGYLQRRGPDGRFGAVKASGSWDVGYPLEDFGAQSAWNDIAVRYMTVQELDNHLETVAIQNVNTVRWEMLHRVLDNVQLSFTDIINGTVTVEPLANGDTVVYPPVLGASAEATEDHYLEAGYLSAAISDANNPIVTIVADLEHHFSLETGNSNIFVFINGAQKSVIEDLTDFNPITDRFIQASLLAERPQGWPASVPGRPIGRTNGAWIIEWPWMPANYLFGIHGDAPPPLKKRVDPSDTGLPRGLALVAQDDKFPFESAQFRHRFGFGTANRLNGVVMELGTGGTYTIPAAYD